MALLDFLKPAPAVSRSEARRAVYVHRIAKLEAAVKASGPQDKAVEAEVYAFIHEFFSAFYGVSQKSGIEAIGQIESAVADLKTRNRAVALFKKVVQYEKLSLRVGKTELLDMISSCRELLELG